MNSRQLRGIIQFILLFLTNIAYSQGPDKAFFYDPEIVLPWSTCRIYYEYGSGFEIKYLPVTSRKVLPLGMNEYNDFINVSGQIYLDPDGFIENIDPGKARQLHNSILMSCYDLSDEFGIKSFIELNYEKLIRYADSLQMQAVILYSIWDENPLFFYKESDLENIADIPVIVTNKFWAEKILTAAGVDKEVMEIQPANKKSYSRALTVKADIRIQGFKKTEANYMDFFYDPSYVNEQRVKKLIHDNDSSIQMIRNILSLADNKSNWTKVPYVLFNNFDQQFFYSARKGYGVSSENLISVVMTSSKFSFDLIIHENTHRYLYENWGHSSSFMDEGVAEYVEAMATEPDINHLKCVQFLQENRILSFNNYLDADIGEPGDITAVGYPLSGSFIDFIVKTYSLDYVYKLYKLESNSTPNRADHWKDLFGLDPDSLFNEWKKWLIKNYQ